MRSKRYLIAAGGSGGHLFPAQQLATLLQGKGEILFGGHKLELSPFFEKSRFAYREISAAAPTLRGLFRFIFSSLRGIWQGIRAIRKFRPDVVIGFGSFHTFPLLVAATILRKKIILFEPNCTLGKVNRLFLPAATKLALQFPLEKPIKTQVFVPLLPWVLKPDQIQSREKALAYFGLKSSLLTILVFGGSQGAAFLNGAIPQVLNGKKGIQIIHFTGKKGGIAYDIPACVKEFETQMPLAYLAADIVICRSGAGTVAELLRHQKPALLIPYPYAGNHQVKNGEFLMSQVGGALLLEQRLASSDAIDSALKKIIQGKETMQRALQSWTQKQQVVDFTQLIQDI